MLKVFGKVYFYERFEKRNIVEFNELPIRENKLLNKRLNKLEREQIHAIDRGNLRGEKLC